MKIFLKAIHRDLCGDYSTHILGGFEDSHPLVLKMLDECAPRPDTESKRYEEFVTEAIVGIAYELGTPNNPEQYKPFVRRVVSEKDFFKIMSAFAIGVQFAARKVGGNVDADKYSFLTEIGEAEGEKPFRSFFAAADKKELALNPLYMVLFSMDQSLLNNVPHPPDLDLHEHYILAGVEEMLHLYQEQQGQHTRQYNLTNFDRKAYDADPMEKEADILIDVAVRELGLGPKYRGTGRG